MPEDGCDQVELGDLTLGGVDAFGQPRDRHADVGGEGRRARPQMASGPITVVARLPEPAAVLRLGRPVERPAAEVRDDVAEALRLLGNAGVAAVEFDEQRRHFRQRQFRISVDGLDLQRVEQFDARNRNAGLDRENGCLAGGIDRGKRADAGGDRFGDSRQLERELGDDAEGSFRTDHQPREIVAGGRLFRAARGGHQLAIGHHHFHRQHIVLHGAVAHRVSARAARRRHAAERSVGAGVDGKEQALVAQLLVERLAGDAGLDHAIEILGVHRQHLVHVAEIDRYAAERRVDVALERGADAERYDRHTVRRADADDGLHVVGVLRKHHRVRRLVGDPGQRIAVLLAHRLRGDDAVAERRGQRGDRRRDRGRIARLYRCLLICCARAGHRLLPRISAANVAGMTGEVKRSQYGADARSSGGAKCMFWTWPSQRSATRQQYQVQTTGWSFFGSAGLLLLADMAHTTIITATASIYAPRANLPIMAPPPLVFFQHSQEMRSGAAIVNFWLMPPSH